MPVDIVGRWLRGSGHPVAGLLAHGETFESAWYRSRLDEDLRLVLEGAAAQCLEAGTKSYGWLQERLDVQQVDGWEPKVYRRIAERMMRELGTWPDEWVEGQEWAPVLPAWRYAGSGGEHAGVVYDGMQVWCELCSTFHHHGGLEETDRFALGRLIEYGGHCGSRPQGWTDYWHRVVGWYPDGIEHGHVRWHTGCRCEECREGRQVELKVKGMSGRRTDG